MRNDAVPEKCRNTATSTVEELIRNHELERLVFFLQGSHGADGKNTLNPELFHAINVGAEIQL